MDRTDPAYVAGGIDRWVALRAAEAEMARIDAEALAATEAAETEEAEKVRLAWARVKR